MALNEVWEQAGILEWQYVVFCSISFVILVRTFVLAVFLSLDCSFELKVPQEEKDKLQKERLGRIPVSEAQFR